MTEELNVIYGSRYSFSEYRIVRKYYDISFLSKYYKLLWFFHQLNVFRNLILLTEKNKNQKENCV